MKRTYWSSEEKEKLIDLYENQGFSTSEIAPLMKRTPAAIKLKIGKLKLKHSAKQTSLVKSRLNLGDLNGMYGKQGWNKNQTKETNGIIEDAARKMSQAKLKLFQDGTLQALSGEQNGMFGKLPWNNGLTKETDVRIKNAGRKASESKKEQWLTMPEIQKDAIRKQCARIGSQKKTMTSIEIKTHKLLEELNIKFIPAYQMDFYVCDVFLPDYNVVIECQGDYWHGNPRKYSPDKLNAMQKRNQARDKAKKTFLFNKKINLLCLWEYDINYNIAKVKEEIVKFTLEKSLT